MVIRKALLVIQFIFLFIFLPHITNNMCEISQKDIKRLVVTYLAYDSPTIIVTAPKMDTYELFILKYSDYAVKEMYRTGIPASIKLAQGLLESEAGESYLATFNIFFGIKCKNKRCRRQNKKITSCCVRSADDTPYCRFRRCVDPLNSFKDHSDFLVNTPRYRKCFKCNTGDYKCWAKRLKKAGYATDPTYAYQLIYLIEKYSLNVYDLK